MAYTWGKVVNIKNFTALGIPQRTYTNEYSDWGEESVTVCRGFYGIFTIIFRGFVLILPQQTEASYNFYNQVSAYIDADFNLWVGVNND